MPTGFLVWTSLLEHRVQHIIKLRIREKTKMVAFADDVILAVKAETIREVENLANIEMGKITNGPKIIK